MSKTYETDLQLLKEHLQGKCDNFMDDIMDKFNTIQCGNCGEFIINRPDMNEENREGMNQPTKFTRQELIGIGLGFSMGQGSKTKEDLEKNINWFLEKCNHEKLSHKRDDRFFLNTMDLALQLVSSGSRN